MTGSKMAQKIIKLSAINCHFEYHKIPLGLPRPKVQGITDVTKSSACVE